MGGLVMVLARFHIPAGRRLDENIDVLREPADDVMTLREGRSAFQLECEAKLLKPVKAMHDPVVFFNEGRINALFFRHDPDQIRKILVIVEKITRHSTRSLLAPAQRISSLVRFHTREPRGASAAGRTPPRVERRAQGPRSWPRQVDRRC